MKAISNYNIALVDQTCTPFGKRQLQQWLCQPLASRAAIESRLDSVQDLIDNEALARSISQLLSKYDLCCAIAYKQQRLFGLVYYRLPDIERLLTRVHQRIAKQRELLQLIGAFAAVRDFFARHSKLDNDERPHLPTLRGAFLRELFDAPPPLRAALERVQATFTGTHCVVRCVCRTTLSRVVFVRYSGGRRAAKRQATRVQ
jgi:DNA mismatch repair ATPase MutS